MIGLEHWDAIIDQYPILTWQEHGELAKQRDEGGRRGAEALDKLVLHNLLAVAKRVEQMNCKPDLKHDLMSAGMLGLRKAAERWQPIQKEGFDQPAPFITSAYWWIREAIAKEAGQFWHDDFPLDAEDDGDQSRDSIIGARSDNYDFMSVEALAVLSKNERAIINARSVDFTGEDDEELSRRLKIKPSSLGEMLERGILKLLNHAA